MCFLHNPVWFRVSKHVYRNFDTGNFFIVDMQTSEFRLAQENINDQNALHVIGPTILSCTFKCFVL